MNQVERIEWEGKKSKIPLEGGENHQTFSDRRDVDNPGLGTDKIYLTVGTETLIMLSPA